jgi:RimJ/RimL family protein N-acetyltransferase
MRVDTLTLVREARSEDVPVICDVHVEAWRAAYRNLFESAFLAKQLESVCDKWDGREYPGSVLVAERGHRIVAFAHFGSSAEGDGKGEIFDYYARPTAWGSGVAGTLLTRVLETLADSRHRDVRAWTLSGANRARHFYRKAGFRESGRYREQDYGDRRPVMELEYVRSIRHLHR